MLFSKIIFLGFAFFATVHVWALSSLKTTDSEIEILKNVVSSSKGLEGRIPTDFSYNVSGAYTSFISNECHYRELKKLLKNSYENTSALGNSLQGWVSSCDQELSRFYKNPLVSLVNFELIEYSFENNPKLKNVVFEYDKEKIKIRGILGFKDNKRRPLVIMRNGVYGNASETPVSKSMIMHFMDEGPFHVLFLGNITGDEFIKDNSLMAMGGLEEGRQFHRIIEILTHPESPYAQQIEDIHIVGVSLGGNGALFSGVYDAYREESKIKSVVAICPVVNLEKSMDNVFSDSVLGRAYSFVTYGLLRSVFQYVPVLGELLKEDAYWSQSEISNAVKEGVIKTYIQRTEKQPWDMAPFEGVQIRNADDFWKFNNFVNYADQVKNPTLIIHGRDDFIVPSNVNSDLLKSNLNSNIGMVEFQNGSHCAFNVANGWPTISTLLREFILKHSSYQISLDEKTFELKYLNFPRVSKNHLMARYEWQLQKDKTQVQLNVRYLDKMKRDEQARFNCRKSDYRSADAVFCYGDKTFSVDIQSFYELGVKMPTTDLEANILTRWFNTHVIPVAENGEVPYGLPDVPVKFIVDQKLQ